VFNIGTATITPMGNGWYRCSYTQSAISTTIGRHVMTIVSSATSTRLEQFDAVGGQGLYIWGAQLVEGTDALPYQRTTTRLNISRADYSLGGCPNILLEPQRTNLSTWSEDFSNVIWSKSAGVSISTNSAIAPNGLMTADIIDFGAFDKFVSQATTATTGVSLTGTFYIKGIAGQTIQIAVAGVDQLFTLDGTWQRLGHTRTTTGTIFGLNVNTFGSSTARVISLWGAQLEAGSYPTSYIPTTSAAVTRNADVISKTGISSLIGQTEGTIFVNSYIDHSNVDNSYLHQIRASNDTRIFIYRESVTNKLGCFALIGGSVVYTTLTSGAITGNVKAAFAYKSGSFAFYVNGLQVGISSASLSILATLSEFTIDSNNGIENGFFSYNAAALWTTRLTNAQLAQLTTI
jgi:hypothetical protein